MTSKKTFKLVAFLSGAVIFIVIGTLYSFDIQRQLKYKRIEKVREFLREMTPQDCSAAGGTIENTLTNGDLYFDKNTIGEVTGMMCPCVCVLGQKNSAVAR